MRTSVSILIDNILSESNSALFVATLLVTMFGLVAVKKKLFILTFFNFTFIFTFTFNPVLDSLYTDNAWTFVSQSIKGLQRAPLGCGISYDTKLYDNQNESIQEYVTKNSASATLTPGDFYYSPCLTPISTKEGRWEMPDIRIGNQIYDQQRLLLNTEQHELGCNSILLENNQLSKEEFCFYKVSSTIPELNFSVMRKYFY
jgi:hypothetical protein